MTSSDGCVSVNHNLLVGLDYADITAVFTVTPSSCGGSTGSICVNATGGSGNFNFTWTGPPSYNTTLSTSPCLSGVAAGFYQLRIDDNNTICHKEYTRYITDAPLTLSGQTISSSCDGNCNGSITLNLSGNTSPVNISWTGPSSGVVNAWTQSTYVIPNLCAGTYSVTVSGGNCNATQTFTVGQNNADITISNCNGTIMNPIYFNGQSDVTLGGNLIVTSGACLEIDDMTLRFKPGKYIRVMGGAKLIVNRSILDAGCGAWWEGIEVLSAQPNTTPSNRGQLIMEDCTITHAYYGITNYQSNLSYVPVANTQGGNIKALKVQFIDNSHDVYLERYAPVGQINTQNQGARFEDCSFLLSTYPYNTSDGLANHGMISLINMADVHFNNCRSEIFNSSYLKHSVSAYWKRFFYSAYSSFIWDGCSTDGTLCNQSYIKGYIYGVWSTGELMSSYSTGNFFMGPIIKDTYFNCYRGTYISNTSECAIIDNHFALIPFSNVVFPTSYFYGISIQYPAANASSPNPSPNAGTHLLVAGNIIDFAGASGSISANLSGGVFIYNAGEHHNFVVKNLIRNCAIGCQFDDRNKGSDFNGMNAAPGLHYECNNFQNCYRDVVIRDPLGPEGDDAGVFGRQSSFFNSFFSSNSAGNSFTNSISGSPNDDIELSILATSAVHSYRYNNLDLNSNGIGEMTPGVLISNLSLPNDCEYDYSHWTFQNTASTIAQLQNDLSALRSAYFQFIDNGQTQQLKSAIENTVLNNVLEMYNVLVQTSPKLSEDVMLKAIENSHFPNSLLVTVLALNPSSAKSGVILKALKDREIPLTEYQWSLINQGLVTTSPKEVLEAEMVNLSGQISRLRFDALINQAINQSNDFGVQEFISSLDQNFSFGDYLTYAQVLMRSGEFEQGFNLLNDVPVFFKLEDTELNGIKDYSALLRLEHDLLTREDRTLLESDVDLLSSIYETDPCGYGQRAYEMLEVFAGFPELDQCNELSNSETRVFGNAANISNEIMSNYEAFPNPVCGEVLIIRSQGPIVDVDHVEIKLSNGTTFHWQAVEMGQSEIIVDARILSIGENLVCVFSKNGQVIQTLKVIRK